MDKLNLTKDELNNVAGGNGGGGTSNIVCSNCRNTVKLSDTIVRVESHGCHKKHYCKCPICGYEWTVGK